MSTKDHVVATLKAWFAAHEDHVVETASQLVQIPSVNPKFDSTVTPGGEAQVQEFISDYLEGIGRSSTVYEVSPGRANLYTTDSKTTCPRSLVFNGHIDVVPEGDHDQWATDPFGGEVRDGKIYGRGAMDMKGGVACAMTAIRAIQETGIELDGCLGLHAVVDEEAGGFGTRDLLGRIPAPKAVVVNEPSNEELQIAEGGLEWVRVVLKGRNNHSAWRYSDIYPQPAGSEPSGQGMNAITLAAEFVSATEKLEREWAMSKRHPLLPPGFTTISPGVLRAGSGSDAEHLPKLYDNPAMVPDTAAIDFDIKFFPGEEKKVRAEFEEFVHSWAGQYAWFKDHPPLIQWELKGLYFPSMDTSENDPLVRTVAETAQPISSRVKVAGFPAVSDAAFYSAAGSSAVIFGPVGGGLHAPDEWVDVESLRRVALILALTAVHQLGVK